MRAFVTGGSGFIGRELIAALRARGDAVSALARSDEAMRAVAAAGAVPVRGELGDEAALRAGMTGHDVVFHLAGKVGMWGPRAEFARLNVGGTECVLAAANAAGVPRLVHVSTEAVLLHGVPLRGIDESLPLPAHPLGPYAWSKGEGERRVRAASSSRLTTVVVRPRLVWGRGDRTVLPRIADAVGRGRFRWIDGGRYRTSTCHVRNAVEGLLAAAERGRGGEAYFLTDGEPVEFRAFLTALLRTQGIDAGTLSIPGWAAWAAAGATELAWRGLRRRDEPPLYRAALDVMGHEVTVQDDKARRELGYRAMVTREQGLAEMTLHA